MEDWKHYQKLILAEIAYLRSDNKEIKEAIISLKENHLLAKSETRMEVALLKAKSSFWGTLGGSLTVIVYLFFEWASSKLKS